MTSIDSLIEKATDATLTTDNWQYILDVTDAISANPESGTKEGMAALIARLNQKDANVVLRSLALMVAMGENCGSRMKQELASKRFLDDCLIRKLGDRKTHRTVKVAVAAAIGQLNQLFRLDPSLRPMADAYAQIRRQFPQYLNDNLSVGLTFAPAPSKPAKQQMTPADKQREDDELQRALKVSLQEYEREQTMAKIEQQEKQQQTWEKQHQPQQKGQVLAAQPTSLDPASIATVSKVRALYDLISYEPDELSFRKGDVITVIESVYRDWWRGFLPNGTIGIFPLNYVTPIVRKSPEELKKEEAIEQRILERESNKVDRLMALLLSPNADENEVTALYNEIVPLRPQVGKFIDKYGGRKEELMQLHTLVNKELKEYNELVDQQIAAKRDQYTQPSHNPAYTGFQQPPQSTGQYGQSSQGGYQPTGQGYATPGEFLQYKPTGNYPYQATQPTQNQYQSYQGADAGQFQGYKPTSNPPGHQQVTGPPPTLFQNYRPTGNPQETMPALFQNYKPTGSTQETGPVQNLFQNYKPTGGYGGLPYEPDFSSRDMPMTLFTTGTSLHSNGSQYSQPYYTQLKEYLQQQPTSAGFGNSPA